MFFGRKPREHERQETPPAPQDAVRRALDEACRSGRPARVVTPDGGVLLEARFVEHGGRIVRLALEGTGDADRVLQPFTCVCVLFNDGSGHRAFLTSVDRCAPGAGGWALDLRIPDSLAGGNGRATFRVPVGRDSGLEAEVEDARGTRWPVRVTDMSLGGVSVAWDDAGPGDVGFGDDLTFHLALGGRSAEVQARVRYVDRESGPGLRLGMAFLGAVRDGEVEPPETVRSIFSALEAAWIRQRAR
ncbi:PilZ domain-containing protein [Myxococcota bacterium]|nr:PilZ domain-containing protein [Myxococcota bacterium]